MLWYTQNSTDTKKGPCWSKGVLHGTCPCLPQPPHMAHVVVMRLAPLPRVYMERVPAYPNHMAHVVVMRLAPLPHILRIVVEILAKEGRNTTSGKLTKSSLTQWEYFILMWWMSNVSCPCDRSAMYPVHVVYQQCLLSM